MKQYKLYYPYKSDRPEKKYFVIVLGEKKDTYKKIYFGSSKYEHFTFTPEYKDKSHLDWVRRERYEDRHKKNEDWSNPHTSGFWSYWYLWKYPTTIEAYKMNIEKKLKNTGYPVGASISV